MLSGREMGEVRQLIDSFYHNAEGYVCSWYAVYKKTKYQWICSSFSFNPR